MTNDLCFDRLPTQVTFSFNTWCWRLVLSMHLKFLTCLSSLSESEPRIADCEQQRDQQSIFCQRRSTLDIMEANYEKNYTNVTINRYISPLYNISQEDSNWIVTSSFMILTMQTGIRSYFF